MTKKISTIAIVAAILIMFAGIFTIIISGRENDYKYSATIVFYGASQGANKAKAAEAAQKWGKGVERVVQGKKWLLFDARLEGAPEGLEASGSLSVAENLEASGGLGDELEIGGANVALEGLEQVSVKLNMAPLFAAWPGAVAQEELKMYFSWLLCALSAKQCSAKDLAAWALELAELKERVACLVAGSAELSEHLAAQVHHIFAAQAGAAAGGLEARAMGILKVQLATEALDFCGNFQQKV